MMFELALLSIFLSGYAIICLLFGNLNSSFLEKMCLSFVFGCGFIGILIHFLFLFNLPLNLLYLIVPQLILVIIFLIRAPKIYGNTGMGIKFNATINYLELILLIAIIFEIAYCFLVALWLPFVNWDSWSQHGFRSQIIFLSKSLPLDNWINPVNLPNADYPFLISNIGVYIYLTIGRIYEPFYKLLSALFFPGIMIFCYIFLHKYFSRKITLLSILLLTLIPFMNASSSTGYLDIIISFCFVGIFLYLSNYLENFDERDLAICAVLLGISAWVKNEGLAFWVTVLASLICLIIFKKIKMGLSKLLTMMTVSCLIYIPWLIFKCCLGLKGTHFVDFSIKQIIHEFIIRFYYILQTFYREITNFGKWNVLWILFIITFIFFIFDKEKDRFSILLSLLVLFQLAIYWIIYLIWPVNLEEWRIYVFFSQDRLLLHLTPLVFLFIVLEVKRLKFI